ncbi:hypothetical protein FOZ63_008551, partial [Perkinsus olseni]
MCMRVHLSSAEYSLVTAVDPPARCGASARELLSISLYCQRSSSGAMWFASQLTYNISL